MDQVPGLLEHAFGPARSFAEHADLVCSVAEGAIPTPEVAPLAGSWRRSAGDHGVDPTDPSAPRILTSGELREFREPLSGLIVSGREEMDRLYAVVRDAGYTVLFCDAAGIAVEQRGDDTTASQFEYWGTCLGGVWSEAVEGTNGIGTCIAEERPVSVHRNQHFRSRHRNLSCSGAPIFDVDGSLMAVLDVSAIDPERSEQAHALTGALTADAARATEERRFREHFHRSWIVSILPEDPRIPGMLLAVDGDQRIIGANRVARLFLLLDDRGLRNGVSLWAIFERDPALFREAEGADIAGRLTIIGGNDDRPVIVTPPVPRFAVWRGRAAVASHMRPRLDVMDTRGTMAPATQTRGGLSPGAMRRVRDHVEAHLSESIDLPTLASVAGLSIHHFARAFKQTAGVTPHHFLTRKRVERAQEMLAGTDLSLSEVAFAAGFSDQSHLARHFRQMLGITPGRFRWSQAGR